VSFAGSGHVIRNNAMHHLPVGAMLMEGKNTLIELNELFEMMQQGNEVHAMYAWANTDSNNEIRYNYFHDVPRPPAPWSNGWWNSAIALDANASSPPCSGFDIHGNVVHRFGDGTISDVWQKGQVAGIMPKPDNRFHGNVFVRVDAPAVVVNSGAEITGNQSWLTRQPLPAGNVTGQAPGFVDEPRGKLANRPDGSLVVAGTSEVIPFGSIGLR
jgi:hypothetical protein